MHHLSLHPHPPPRHRGSVGRTWARTKSWLSWLGAILLLAAGVPRLDAQAPLRLATYNIRYDNPGDGVNAWPHRREAVLGLIRYHRFDVVGIQEALHHQVSDLATLDGYEWVGVGRDDGVQAGEYCPIFFRTDRLTLLEHGTFWLSEEPERPSFGWDAACRRVCTWATFRDVCSGVRFQVWNVHLDQRGAVARAESAKLIRERIDPLLEQGERMVLLGDFNLLADDPIYRTMTRGLLDAYRHALTPVYGPVGTSNRFNYTGSFLRRIDYILLSPEMTVLRYAVLTDSHHHQFPSDHFPVVVDALLSPAD